MEIWQIILLAAAGIVAGWINVMAGGGSLLTVPIMLFMGIPAPVANGTNRIAILAQNVVSVPTFHRRGYSDIKLSLSLSAAATVGAVFGANVGVHFSGVWFNRVLAIIMVAVMIIMATGGISRKDASGSTKPRRRVLGHILMVGAGFWGGFIQIGVGFILMPILHRVMGLDLVHTNMHKVFIALMYTIAALIVFASQLELMWWVGIALAAGNAIGGWLGAHTSVSKGEIWIRRVLYFALTAFIIKLLLFP